MKEFDINDVYCATCAYYDCVRSRIDGKIQIEDGTMGKCREIFSKKLCWQLPPEESCENHRYWVSENVIY